MSQQITLQLSDDLVARAYEIATRSDQALEDALVANLSNEDDVKRLERLKKILNQDEQN